MPEPQDRPDLTLTTVNLSARDVRQLAYFYRDLLGWEIAAEEPEWILLRAERGGVGLSVEHDEAFQRPVWPSRPGQQTLQVLDVRQLAAGLPRTGRPPVLPVAGLALDAGEPPWWHSEHRLEVPAQV